MKAIDTVMSDEQIAQLLADEFRRTQGREIDVGYFGASPNDQAIAKAQAEISFPLGKQEGRREVVEWLVSHGYWHFLEQYVGYVDLQAKLKEWGTE